MGGGPDRTTVLSASTPGNSIWEKTALYYTSVFLLSAFCTEPNMLLALSKHAVGWKIYSPVHHYKCRETLLSLQK